MADISAEIAAFKNAVYGEDVRDAMVSLANKINTESSGAASSVEDYIPVINSTASTVKGFTLLENAIANEAIAYKHIVTTYVDGDASAFEGLRIGIFSNTSSIPKRMVLYNSVGNQTWLNYNATSGYNVGSIGNNKIYVLVDWDSFGSQILVNSATYSNLHIEYSSIPTFIDFSKLYDSEQKTIIDNEINALNIALTTSISDTDFRTYVKNIININYGNLVRGSVPYRTSEGYVYIAASGYYGFREYEIHEGSTYKIEATNVQVVKGNYVLAFILSERLTEDRTIIPSNNILYLSSSDFESTFPIISYSFKTTAPYNGYLYLYRQYSTSDSGLKVMKYTSVIDSVDNYCMYLKNLIDQTNESYEKSIPYIKNIVCSGSSITWGGGNLDDSMVKYLDDHIKENMLNTILYSDMTSNDGTVINNDLFYKGAGLLVTGINKEIEFDLYGDEIAICHAKRRSNDYGVIEVYADGTLIGTFDNRNDILSNEETFTGESIRRVELEHPCTFNHQIYINGSSTPLDDVVINTGGYGAVATGNAFVYRKSAEDGSTTHHAIQFSESLGTITSVRVLYNYGRMISYVRNTQGQTNTEYVNESFYGSGTVSFDPANPTGSLSSGLEFRSVDERSFFIHKFTTVKKRHYKLKIIGGVNPYILINFATNRYFNIMNAGVGGWSISLVGNQNIGVCKYTQFGKHAIPELIFQESETNDDWSYPTRRISRDIGEITLSDVRKVKSLEVNSIVYNSSTDKYRVNMATGIISSITSTSLTSNDIIGTDTVAGDIVRIGTYHGDIRQITCREITSVDLTNGIITWIEPINVNNLMNIDSLSELVGEEICIRSLTSYKNAYKTFIENVRNIWGNAKICIVDNGLPNLWTRQLWGYDVIHRKLCSEYPNVDYINARNYLIKGMDETISGINAETITSTGASEYELDYDYSRHAYWQGIKVLVNGVDVYGTDAYVEGTYSYYLKDSIQGDDCNKNGVYDRTNSETKKNGKMKLVFTKNIPSSGETITVQFSDVLWSSDYCHPSNFGSYLYAQAYISAL